TQQLLRILCDSQEPLLEFALLDNSVFVTPATAGNYLLICQYGGALRTPVHFALLTVGKSALVKLQKEPLIPPVVFRQASCNFARPVVGETQALHLRLHVRNVAKCPLAWRSLVRDSGVLRGQSERIPTHGMKHVIAVHPHITCQRVADRII